MDVEIPSRLEYRIEVAEDQTLKIMVTSGIAEIRGLELLNDKWHIFTDIKTAIFTFTGARLRVDGDASLQYLAQSSMIPQVFAYFDQMHAASNFRKNILVLGNGRTTFCATLSNYMIRMHQKATFTEIDPAKGNIFPGTLSSMVLDQFVDYYEGFKLNNPSCLFFGNTEIENTELYEIQIDALVKIIDSRGLESLHMVLSPDLSVEKINNLIKKFNIEEVVIVGNERMFHRIGLITKKVFVENHAFIHGNTISKSINKYFNGVGGAYSPCSFIVKQNWTIVRVGEEHVAPESALPIGAMRKVEKTGINKAELVENYVLAVSEAKTEDEIATSPIACFIVCLDANKFRILCTQSRLPKYTYLIQGNIKFVDY